MPMSRQRLEGRADHDTCITRHAQSLADRSGRSRGTGCLNLQEGELVLAELYLLIGCDLVERAPLDDHHLIWTDEEGWDQATGLTVIDDGTNVIAGRFLVIGTTLDDEPCDITNDLVPVLARFTCHRCIFEPEFETLSSETPHGFFIQQRLKGTRPRIEKIRPILPDC